MRPVIKNRLQLAESGLLHFVLTAEAGATIDDILKPEYWAIVSRDLRPYAEVTVRTDDETFWARLLVLRAGPGWAKMHLLHYSDIAPKAVDVKPDPDFKVTWGGPHHKHRVLRLSDNAVISTGHDSAADANRWIEEHRKALA